MTPRIARLAAAGAACAALSLAGCKSSSSHDEQAPPQKPDYGVTVNAIPGLSSDFLKGADVSMLAQLEEKGAKFYDESGNPGDALKILKDHGVNAVRLRVWNQPVITHDFDTDGMTVHAGESAGGVNDAARDALLAKRAKDLGMKVLLDFHYSDWWADPGKQFLPQAWEGMTLDQLETAIHDYTAATLATMKAAGAMPDMVQIGNETNNGFLWPMGKVDGPNGYDGFAALLSKAAAAVREADPSIQIVIHLANGGDNGLYRSMFTNLLARGVDFDVIGLSYYPYWHGPMAGLQANLDDISAYFNKPVVVVETAYAWTLDDADAEANNFGAQAEALGGYRATVQGQATFLHDLMAVVAGVPDRRGLGVFYWAPEWIAVEGAGWYSGGGDGWDNQTLFDHDGKVLDSANVFLAVSDESQAWVEPTPVSAQDLSVSIPVGSIPTLPTSVNAVYSDDSLRSLYVVWDAVDPNAWNTVGTFDVNGTVVGTQVQATLHVRLYTNLLTNPGFESGGLDGWDFTGPAQSKVKIDASNAHTGSAAFNYYSDNAFAFVLSQTVTGLDTTRTYTFSIWVYGQAASPLDAFATCDGVKQTAAITNTGWAANGGGWHQYTLTGLSGGASGSCTVGVEYPSAPVGDWGWIDDAQLQ